MHTDMYIYTRVTHCNYTASGRKYELHMYDNAQLVGKAQTGSKGIRSPTYAPDKNLVIVDSVSLAELRQLASFLILAVVRWPCFSADTFASSLLLLLCVYYRFVC